MFSKKKVAKIATVALAVSILVAIFAAARKYANARNVVVYEFAGVLGADSKNANAVAVKGGEIEAIGLVEDLRGTGRVDRTFSGLYAARGFHDSSVRLAASCIALSSDFVLAPERWPRKGGGFWPEIKSRSEFVRGLESAGNSWKSKVDAKKDRFAVVFGHATGVHGPLIRSDVDAAFPDAPCIVISRCFGSFTTNSAALKALGILSSSAINRLSGLEGADIPNGIFSGASAMTFARAAFAGERGRARLEEGSKMLVEYLSSVGITSLRDSTSSFSAKKWAESAFGGAPIDVRMSLDPMPAVARAGFDKAGKRLTKELADGLDGEGNVGWSSTPAAHLKIDGAAIAGSGQSKRSDGGTWTWPQEHLDTMCKTFLGRGYAVRYETNGSFGLDMALSHLHRRTFEMPKPPGASHIEILAVEADGEDAAEKAAAVEARVSFDPSFECENSDSLRSFEKLGVETGIHSDMPAGGTGPADPLEAARFARSRGASGRWSMRMLAPPKSEGNVANFAILDSDPTTNEDAAVVGVIFEGKPVKIGRANSLGRRGSINVRDPMGDRKGFDPGYISDAIVEAAYGVKDA
jgi:predicted amidohydrolase YtcJ